MTRKEHLLTILGEEAVEVAHMVSKTLRFGFEEKRPDQDKTNAERLREEFIQLVAMFEMLQEEGCLKGYVGDSAANFTIQKKKDTVERYLEYSKKCGTLQE